jgi:hypothetical protein
MQIGDRNQDEYIFSDAEIQSFLDANNHDIDYCSILYAVADALETIATNDAMLKKRIRLNDLSDDRVAIAQVLITLARQKRELADSIAERSGSGSGNQSFNLPKSISEDYV